MEKQIRTKIEDITINSFSRRPQTFENFVGQDKVKEILMISVQSAKIRKSTLDHILLFGQPGLGKTTLATIVANEMNSKLKTIAGPMIEKPGDVASILCSLNENDILFIDEIHRINRAAEEVLYSAMEDNLIHIIAGQGEQGRQITIDIPKFTLIGATTRAGMLSAPLRDRFGIQCEMQYYSDDELSSIISDIGNKQGLKIGKDESLYIASVSRSTPRIAHQLVARIRDYAFCNSDGLVNMKIINEALSAAGIYTKGLTDIHIRILKRLMDSERPVGLRTLSSFVGESAETIEEMYEPFLIRIGFIDKTPSGRVITSKGKNYLQSI